MNNRKGDAFIGAAFVLVVGFFVLMLFFAPGWDTGLMSGKIIGYDTALFGTKKVFVLEERTVFNEGSGYSQSQVVLCSDHNDYDIHKLIEENMNQKVVIEYRERRVGFYTWGYCHESPITNITRQS